MVELACVTGYIAAPADQIWEVLTDFGHPQRLARSIEACEMTGHGVGAVRRVTVRGRTIHERLELLDSADYTLSYRALDIGDMPAPGIAAYLATVSLRAIAEDLTKIVWRGEGEVDGSEAPDTRHFVALYERAIENLRLETACSLPSVSR